jgi:SAM-dependent methyltransferase
VANEQNRKQWDRSGQSWVEFQRTFDCLLEPIGTLLLDHAAIRDGERVLDVGCGYGTTSLEIIQLGASVHGVDISTPMIDAARARVPQATFDVTDAQTEPLGGPYDAVVSRFGVMFFDDPVAAFTNIGNSTAPGGRMTFVCWNDQARSSAAWAGGEVLVAALPSPPPAVLPNAPGMYAFADPDRTRTILSAAGWTDISINGHEVPCAIGWPNSDGVEERLAMLLGSEMGQLMRDQVAVEDQPAVVEAMRASLSDRVVDGAIRLHASIWLVSATCEPRERS